LCLWVLVVNHIPSELLVGSVVACDIWTEANLEPPCSPWLTWKWEAARFRYAISVVECGGMRALKELVEAAKGDPDILAVFLYGSHARGAIQFRQIEKK